ncbi:MAG: exosortase A [Sphingosinicella sp.]
MLGAAWAGLLVLFIGDAADLVSVWWNSSTFNHCLLIVPIIAWLVWQRVPHLRSMSPAFWMWGLASIVLGGFVWLVGNVGDINIARQAGLLLMMQGAVLSCLGLRVARVLAFPLLYALFLLPIGEELVPPLQTVTAYMTAGLLWLSGVPAYFEGIYITIPNGLFEIAEACAGVKFLVAMLALAALVMHLCFRSWRRRLTFLMVAIVVPILANGIRAWATIYVAHLTGIETAEGFDHVVYGWLFFAIVIFLVMVIGWRFFDRGPDDDRFAVERP